MWIAARLCIALIENQIPIGLTTDLMEVAFKTAIMVGLAVIWLNRNQRGLWLENRKLYQFEFPVVFWLLLALFIGYLGIDMWVKFHGFHFHSNVINSGQFFGSTICAGVTEELLFRGFFMNSLLKHHSFWPANIIQVILFQLSHVPLYLIEGLSLMDGFPMFWRWCHWDWYLAGFSTGQRACGQVRSSTVCGTRGFCYF